jgi:hypothetical protein
MVGGPQIECDGGELVDDSDGERFWARAGGGGMLEEFNGDGGEADFLLWRFCGRGSGRAILLTSHPCG